MKKICLFILWLCALFFVWNFTQAKDYEYSNLNIAADILEDWTINVKENYKANFFVNKHGIIRDIPLNYSVWGTVYHVDISDIDVRWKTFETSQYDKWREIKIWDADKTIIWEQIYPISYTVYGLIKNFSEMWYAELYWNLVWNEFDTNINNVRAVLHLPKAYTGFTSDDFLITTDWKSKTIDWFEWTVDWSQWDKIVITYDKWLPAYQWITIAVKFPNDYFKFDHKKQAWLLWRIEDVNSNDKSFTNNIVENDSKYDYELLDSPSKIVEDSNNEDEIKPSSHKINSNDNTSSSTSSKEKLIGSDDYEYTDFNITANILADWTIDVSEDISAYFRVNKHGIIRAIPLNYSVWWQNFHIDISNINVPWKKFTKNKSNWNIEIKIWDANRTVIWEQNYPISYSTYGLIRNFSWMWYAELYWNLVGYDFDTNINRVKAELILPKAYNWFSKDDFLITTDWATNTIDWFEWTVDWSKWGRIIITYDKWLSAYHWITLAIKFPNDYFEFDHKRQSKLIGSVWSNSFNFSWGSFRDSLLSIIETFGFIGLFIYAYIKKRKNKISKIDKKSWFLKWEFADKFPVIVQYTPPQWINPAEAWLLLHREAKAKDMLSLIYKRAAEWLINISIEKTEWSIFSSSKDIVIITKNRDIPWDLPGYEQDFFRSLLRGEKNKITESTNLYGKLGLSALESFGKKKWWFTWNNLRSWAIAILILVAFFLLDFIAEIFPWLYEILFLAFIFWCIYLSYGPKLKETEEWAKLISYILWYREFLAMCDENKLRLFLEQDPLYFDKILPYAVAFWLETELLKKIEPIMREMNIRPTRYNWDFTAMYLIDDIVSSAAKHSVSYSSSGWFSGWSSFGWWFSFWWWGGGGWWRSW